MEYPRLFDEGGISREDWFTEALAHVREREWRPLVDYRDHFLDHRLRQYARYRFSISEADVDDGGRKHANTIDDVLQHTWVGFMSSFERLHFATPAALDAWHFRAVRNRAISLLRHQPTTPDLSLEEKLIGDYAFLGSVTLKTHEQTIDMRSALGMLKSENQRAVIILKFYGGLSNLEIQQVLGLADEGAAKSLQHRGLQSLARIMSGKRGETLERQIRATSPRRSS